LENISRHIIGDHIYAINSKSEKSERILLHALTIYFIHPRTKQEVSFVASIDKTMQEYLDKKFDKEVINEVMDTSNILHSFNTNS
jgi:23S rRNA pseudouridine1911/1915/1917 synthase